MVAIIDLGRPRDGARAPEPERTSALPCVSDWQLRFGLLILALTVILTFGQWLRLSASERIAEAIGGWELSVDGAPRWWCESLLGGRSGILDLPDCVPLRTPYWRDRLERELASNPWIERVDAIERGAGSIRFRARVLRPVAALRAGDRFLVLSSVGQVLDALPAAHFFDRWAVPIWAPQRGLDPPAETGDTIEGDEAKQALAILTAIACAGVLDRWPGAIRELYALPAAGAGDLDWRLVLASETHLDWGRSPASRLPQPLATGGKLANLVEVLEDWERLKGAGLIEIGMESRPLVVVE